MESKQLTPENELKIFREKHNIHIYSVALSSGEWHYKVQILDAFNNPLIKINGYSGFKESYDESISAAIKSAHRHLHSLTQTTNNGE